jgi:hypothetical protein
MCDKCKEFDEKIAHYRRFATYPFDALTVERISGLIANLEKQKQALHPEAPPAE